MSRLTAVLCCSAIALSACGDAQPNRTAPALPGTSGTADVRTRDNTLVVTRNPTPDQVKKCLAAHGLRTVGGAGTPSPGDTDAPDVGEVITNGAFIAFYSSAKRAARYVEPLSRNGIVSRHRKITVLYVAGPGVPAATASQREIIEGCV